MTVVVDIREQIFSSQPGEVARLLEGVGEQSLAAILVQTGDPIDGARRRLHAHQYRACDLGGW